MSTISADDGVSSSSDSTNNSTLVIRASHHSLSPSVMLRQAMRDTNIRSLQFCSIRIGEVVADALTRLILSRHEQGNSIQSIKFLRCRLEELEDPIPLMTALRKVEDRIEFGWSSPIRFLSYCLSESFPSTSPQADTDKTAVERIPSEAEDCCGISTLVLREAHIVDPMASGYPTFPRLNPSNIANHGSLELRQGLSQNTSLKELHISQILSTIQATAISTGLASGASKKQLRVLNLSFCQLNDEQGQDIIQSLQNLPRLEMLDLRGNNCSRQALAALGNWIRMPHCAVELLILSRQEQPIRDAPIEFWNGISQNKSIRRLDLSRNALQVADMDQLGSSIAENETVLELNLSFNKLNDDAMDKFCHHVPSFRTLRRLALRPNPFRSKGAQSLLEAMKENFSLEYLDSLLDLEEAPLLRYYTHLNRGGRRILQSKDPPPVGLWPLLFERSTTIPYYSDNDGKVRPDVLYCLLRNGSDRFIGCTKGL